MKFVKDEQNELFLEASEFAEQGKWHRTYYKIKKLVDSLSDERLAKTHVTLVLRVALMLSLTKKINAVDTLNSIKEAFDSKQDLSVDISVSDLLKYSKAFVIVFKEIDTMSKLYFSGQDYIINTAIDRLNKNMVPETKE